MHPNELDGWTKALTTQVRELSEIRRNLGWFDDDDRDAGVKVRRQPKYPNGTNGIAVPEPDDDERLNLIAVQRKTLLIPRHTK